jgi:hypothetical protein
VVNLCALTKQLQIFDKVVFGLGNVFGLSRDLGLTGTQYS